MIFVAGPSETLVYNYRNNNFFLPKKSPYCTDIEKYNAAKYILFATYFNVVVECNWTVVLGY